MAGALNSNRALAAGIFSSLTPRAWAVACVTFDFQLGFLLTRKGWKWSHGPKMAKRVKDSQSCEAQFNSLFFTCYLPLMSTSPLVSLLFLCFPQSFHSLNPHSLSIYQLSSALFSSPHFFSTSFSFFSLTVVIFCGGCVCCAAARLSCRPWGSIKGSFPHTLRAFFPGSQGQASQMSPADTQLSKDWIPGSKHLY